MSILDSSGKEVSVLWEVSFLGLTEIMVSYHVLTLENKRNKEKNVVKLEIKTV